MAEYILKSGEDEEGPYNTTQLRELAVSGKITGSVLIRKIPDGKWFRAATAKGLMPVGKSLAEDEPEVDPFVHAAGRAAGATANVVRSIGGSIGGLMKRKEAADVSRATADPIVINSPPQAPATKLDATVVDAGDVACPFCMERIIAGAKKCRHCGEILDPTLRLAVPQQSQVVPAIHITNVNTATANSGGGKAWSRIVAALLSFFIPGLGQLYKGQFLNAMAWFFLTICGYYLLIIPGLILHMCCVIGAMTGNPYRR